MGSRVRPPSCNTWPLSSGNVDRDSGAARYETITSSGSDSDFNSPAVTWLHASALDVDFAVLGPVLATPTHPDAPPLGWKGFAAAVANTRVPVYALGGLEPDDLATAIAHGAHGIAMRRNAWPPASD